MTDLICHDVLHTRHFLLSRTVPNCAAALGGLPPLQLAPELLRRAPVCGVTVEVRVVQRQPPATRARWSGSKARIHLAVNALSVSADPRGPVARCRQTVLVEKFLHAFVLQGVVGHRGQVVRLRVLVGLQPALLSSPFLSRAVVAPEDLGPLLLGFALRAAGRGRCGKLAAAVDVLVDDLQGHASLAHRAVDQACRVVRERGCEHERRLCVPSEVLGVGGVDGVVDESGVWGDAVARCSAVVVLGKESVYGTKRLTFLGVS